MTPANQSSESNGDRSLELEVPATPRMASEVRRAFSRLPLAGTLLDDARLLVNELVTNSIRHADLDPGDVIRVRAQVTGKKLRVDVLDRRGSNRPRGPAGAIRPDPGAQSGWGLYLVERISTRWGWGREGYWFELQLG